MTPEVTVYLVPEGLVDVEAWKKRQQKRLLELEKKAASAEKKLKNEGFLKRAPAHVVEFEKKRLEEARTQLERIKENLRRVG